MASLTFTIKPDELLGLSALVELARAADGGDAGTGTGAVSKAKALMRTALADKLEQAGCPGLRPRKQPASAPPRPRRRPAPCAGSQETGKRAKAPRTRQLPPS